MEWEESIDCAKARVDRSMGELEGAAAATATLRNPHLIAPYVTQD